MSGNEIARRVGVAPSTVRLTLKRLAAAGFSWPLRADVTDPVLEGQGRRDQGLRYEPQVNRTSAEMAAHYDTAVLPAQPRRPRDKAKVMRGDLPARSGGLLHR